MSATMRNRMFGWLPWVVLAGCAPVGPDHRAPEMNLPASFSRGGVEWQRSDAGKKPRAEAWWKRFGDGELNDLVDRALTGNQDLAASAARLRQAREMSQAARSRYFPNIDLGGTTRRSKSLFRGPGGGANLTNTFSIPVDLSYEVDVWGKVRRQVESAKAGEDAALELLHAQRLTVAGEVAQTYWALRAVDTNRELIARTLEIRRHALKLLTQSKQTGTISGLDLARAETELSTALAESVSLDQSRVELVNALAVLTGVPATGMQVGAGEGSSNRTVLPQPPVIPGAVPSRLLMQRPDIRAAERQVAAANAEIGVAAAAYYPSISIGLSSGYDAMRAADLLKASSLVWSLGSSATVPVLDRKWLNAQHGAAVAAHQAASAEYRQTVLDAIREVENALQLTALLEKRQSAQDQAVVSARKAFDLSTKRFQSGLASFLDVVDAERTRLDSERAANDVRAERLAVAVSLAKALGGEW